MATALTSLPEFRGLESMDRFFCPQRSETRSKTIPVSGFGLSGSFTSRTSSSPLGVLAVEEDGLAIPGSEDLPTAESEKQKSIAVLPFENMSPDPEERVLLRRDRGRNH